ncbi:hypothetical protein PTTG_04090 [Puccinia triticina 1-1 BBBD Race 1]|uniref:Ribosomal protein L33 n=1 Tax=Puccinia triticina (isolate 1-1 / race 1 (BBBD)) TaxID=630390 RepID=A0A180GHT3_PUCT1|nr:hypothetical protein PTTG_04090 [Puccinia triticina 1-1 BBBD Race 1]
MCMHNASRVWSLKSGKPGGPGTNLHFRKSDIRRFYWSRWNTRVKDAPQNADGIGQVSLNCWSVFLSSPFKSASDAQWLFKGTGFFYTTTKVRTAERKIARMKYDPRGMTHRALF